jgi:P-type E1-E2 ATPase
MLSLSIPGFGDLKLEHAIFDYNGTLAISGLLLNDLADSLNALSKTLQIHIVTGDSFGNAKKELANIHCKLTILSAENQGKAKEKYLNEINPAMTVTVGNGRNDIAMLKNARLSIAVIGDEGAAKEAIEAATMVVPNIYKVFDLLNEPRKLIATLRS